MEDNTDVTNVSCPCFVFFSAEKKNLTGGLAANTKSIDLVHGLAHRVAIHWSIVGLQTSECECMDVWIEGSVQSCVSFDITLLLVDAAGEQIRKLCRRSNKVKALSAEWKSLKKDVVPMTARWSHG